MPRYQIIERVDLGKPLGTVDPRAHSGPVVIDLPKKRGDRLVQFGAARSTRSAVTYPEPEPKPDPKPGEGEGGEGNNSNPDKPGEGKGGKGTGNDKGDKGGDD